MERKYETFRFDSKSCLAPTHTSTCYYPLDNGTTLEVARRRESRGLNLGYYDVRTRLGPFAFRDKPFWLVRCKYSDRDRLTRKSFFKNYINLV